jgi:succinate-acetate transporter protein
MVSYLPLVVYCDVQHDFRKNKQKIYSVSFYLELFVLFTLFLFVCSILPVSLDIPFLVARSVFSNVYLPVALDIPFLIAPFGFL